MVSTWLRISFFFFFLFSLFLWAGQGEDLRFRTLLGWLARGGLGVRGFWPWVGGVGGPGRKGENREFRG